MTKSLIIKAQTEGYRRAGRGFSATKATVIPLAELSEEQIAALKADPRLVVVEGAEGVDANAALASGQVSAELTEALAKAEARVKQLETDLTEAQKAITATDALSAEISTLKAALAKTEKAAADAATKAAAEVKALKADLAAAKKTGTG